MPVVRHLSTISDYHHFANLPAPAHPLISLVDYSKVQYPKEMEGIKLLQNYYVIGLKRNVPYKYYYGQQEYDFDGGLMTFIAPKQVISIGSNPNIKVDLSLKPSGWLLLIHPDFLWNTDFAKKIKSYDFFAYAVHEALFLSEKEEQMMVNNLKNIEREYQAGIDKFSQKIIVAQLELLLNYAERYYERQFITRHKSNHQLLERLEDVMAHFFRQDNLMEAGLPTVDQLSKELGLSPSYLSSMLKSLTGLSTQQHIHHLLIEKSKEQLASTQLSVSEIAYSLGFEHPSSFNKLFKRKMDMTPSEFRKAFN